MLPLRRSCESCTKCVLAQSRTKSVFGSGCATEPPVCFIGEAPGQNEDLTGEPFVGRAGQVLTRMIAAMGYTRDQIYLCNVTKCRPPDNRPPTKEECEACNDYLIAQIRAVRPKILVSLGSTATNALLGGKKKIVDIRGKWVEYLGIPLMPTYHPSALARAEQDPNYTELRKSVWADLQMVMHRLEIMSIGRNAPLVP